MKEGAISNLFVRGNRLRSGWRVGLYLASYLVGLLIVQIPVVSLYVALLMSQGIPSP